MAGWLKAGKGTDWVVEQIYLTTLTRRPTAKERELVTAYLKGEPTNGLADLQHALLNANEFLLRH